MTSRMHAVRRDQAAGHGKLGAASEAPTDGEADLSEYCSRILTAAKDYRERRICEET